jgi:hypothetical protein
MKTLKYFLKVNKAPQEILDNCLDSWTDKEFWKNSHKLHNLVWLVDKFAEPNVKIKLALVLITKFIDTDKTTSTNLWEMVNSCELALSYKNFEDGLRELNIDLEDFIEYTWPKIVKRGDIDQHILKAILSAVRGEFGEVIKSIQEYIKESILIHIGKNWPISGNLSYHSEQLAKTITEPVLQIIKESIRFEDLNLGYHMEGGRKK